MGGIRKCLLICAAALIAIAGCSSDDDSGPDGSESPDGAGDGSGSDDRDGSGGRGAGDDDNDDDDDDPSGGAAGDGAGGTSGSGGGNVTPSRLPRFPGAGTSDAGDPLPDGMLCDAVPGADVPIPEAKETCFFDKNDPGSTQVAATLEQVLECVDGTDAIHIRLTFHPWFVDNTYGAGSIGWPPVRGHWFFDLLGSDHAEIIMKDGDGQTVLQFKLDYISADPSQPSGHGSLGVMGGDGSVIVGDASAVVDWSTSLHRNLNERGYGDYIIDSPLTDESYAPNAATPEWDYRVVYEAWIDASIFGDAGFGGAIIEYVHASPAKSENETIEVTPGDCPPPPGCPDGDPDADCGGPPPPPPGCVDNDPDTFCGEAGSSGGGGSGGSGGSGGDPQFCDEHPDDPDCQVD